MDAVEVLFEVDHERLLARNAHSLRHPLKVGEGVGLAARVFALAGVPERAALLKHAVHDGRHLLPRHISPPSVAARRICERSQSPTSRGVIVGAHGSTSMSHFPSCGTPCSRSASACVKTVFSLTGRFQRWQRQPTKMQPHRTCSSVSGYCPKSVRVAPSIPQN